MPRNTSRQKKVSYRYHRINNLSVKTKRRNPYPSPCTIGGWNQLLMPFTSLLIKYLVFLAASIHKKLDFRHLELKVISEKCDPIFKLQFLNKHSPGIVFVCWPSSNADLLSSSNEAFTVRESTRSELRCVEDNWHTVCRRPLQLLNYPEIIKKNSVTSSLLAD